MAGAGKRLRPHTLLTPKPLIHIAGKSIVQHLVETLKHQLNKSIEEIGFVIGNFDKSVETSLLDFTASLGIKGKIYYQHEPLGTAHAVYCAKESLKNDVMVAFADTLFRSDVSLNNISENLIWTKEVEDPSQFGVVRTDEESTILEFVEKPKDKNLRKAIIGIYYFKNGKQLHDELDDLIKNDRKKSGEYQLTCVLETIKNKGGMFKSVKVDEWMDFGNQDACLDSLQLILKGKNSEKKFPGTKIIEPCFIGKDVIIEDSEIGPFVSLEQGCVIRKSKLKNSILQERTTIGECTISHSMIGSNSNISGIKGELSIGDFSTIK